MKKIFNFITSNCILIYYVFIMKFTKRLGFDNEFTILVVSKDRPFLLRSFLLSAQRSFSSMPPIIALINCSNSKSKERYDSLYKELENKINLSFQFEGGAFKTEFYDILIKIKTNKIMLCVDDQIFFRDIYSDDLIQAGRDVNFLTLRFGENTNYSYNLDKVMKKPFNVHTYGNYLSWTCGLEKNDFHYPLSFDSTIFDKCFLVLMARFLIYKSPNQFEGYMNYCKIFIVVFSLKIGCFKDQIAVNFVLNKVQTDNSNRSLGFSIDELNSFFDDGLYLAADERFSHQFSSSHCDFGYSLREIN